MKLDSISTYIYDSDISDTTYNKVRLFYVFAIPKIRSGFNYKFIYNLLNKSYQQQESQKHS